MKDPAKVRAGRIGGLTNAGTHDPKAMTAAATRGLLARFEREADPDGILEPSERLRRAVALRRAHLIRIRGKGR